MSIVVLLPLGGQLRGGGAVGVKREVLVEQGLHVQRRLLRRLVAEAAGLELGEDPKSVDGPLFKLLQCDVGGRWDGVKVHAVRVIGRLVRRVGELLLSMIGDIAPFGILSTKVLPEHGDYYNVVEI